MKYTKNFNRDFRWYLRVRHQFTFSGGVLRTKHGDELKIQFDPAGIDGKEAYFRYDSTGKLLPTRHPNLLHSLLKTKAAVNFQIKQWAEDRAKGMLPKILFSIDEAERIYTDVTEVRQIQKETIEVEYLLPQWVVDAVENQKRHFY